jgi:hypothetical protein
MLTRCRNPKNKSYHNYGGRGITVSPVFTDPYQGFWRFVEELGERPSPKHSLDRIDNNRGYEPGNIRWATTREQLANRRPPSEWSRKLVEGEK